MSLCIFEILAVVFCFIPACEQQGSCSDNTCTTELSMKCQNNTIEVEHSGDRWVFMFSDEPCIWQKNPQHCDHSTIYLDVGNGQNVTLCSRDYCILKEALSGCPFRVMFPTTETACRPHFTHQCTSECCNLTISAHPTTIPPSIMPPVETTKQEYTTGIPLTVTTTPDVHAIPSTETTTPTTPQPSSTSAPPMIMSAIIGGSVAIALLLLLVAMAIIGLSLVLLVRKKSSSSQDGRGFGTSDDGYITPPPTVSHHDLSTVGRPNLTEMEVPYGTATSLVTELRTLEMGEFSLPLPPADPGLISVREWRKSQNLTPLMNPHYTSTFSLTSAVTDSEPPEYESIQDARLKEQQKSEAATPGETHGDLPQIITTPPDFVPVHDNSMWASDGDAASITKGPGEGGERERRVKGGHLDDTESMNPLYGSFEDFSSSRMQIDDTESTAEDEIGEDQTVHNELYGTADEARTSEGLVIDDQKDEEVFDVGNVHANTNPVICSDSLLVEDFHATPSDGSEMERNQTVHNDLYVTTSIIESEYSLLGEDLTLEMSGDSRTHTNCATANEGAGILDTGKIDSTSLLGEDSSLKKDGEEIPNDVSIHASTQNEGADGFPRESTQLENKGHLSTDIDTASPSDPTKDFATTNSSLKSSFRDTTGAVVSPVKLSTECKELGADLARMTPQLEASTHSKGEDEAPPDLPCLPDNTSETNDLHPPYPVNFGQIICTENALAENP